MQQESARQISPATASVWRLTDGLVGGTLVPRPDGTVTPIDHLRIGDAVASRDEAQDTDMVATVTKLTRHMLNRAIELGLETGECVRATGIHRVFTVERGLVAVSLLRVGEHVETYDQVPLRIERITVGADLVSVYEISLDGSPSYFVGAGGVRVQAS